MSSATRHRTTIEAQTWRNTPPYPEHTMYRAVCECGWRGTWHTYRENAERRCVAQDAGQFAGPTPAEPAAG